KGNDIAAWNRHLKANCGSDRELLWDLDSGQDFKIPTLPQTAREGWGTPFLLFLTSGLSASPGICCGDLWLAISWRGDRPMRGGSRFCLRLSARRLFPVHLLPGPCDTR